MQKLSEAALKARTITSILVACMLLTATIPAASGQATELDANVERDARTLVVGRISGNPRKHASRLQRLGQHLVDKHEAFDRVEVILKAKPTDMIEAARRGEIDIVSETLFTALQIEATGQMEMALLEWKENVRAYHSVLLVRADSPF
jgi:ABC-type phosphate/phosphonate transport system substrate-binding protein